AGPAVSLNESPTVQPVTVAACASGILPPWWPSSTSFFALSHAPPWLALNAAINTRVTLAPPSYLANAPVPRPKPTAIGANTANRPGVASSRNESRVTMSTTLPYSGLVVPSMIPGMVLNWRRTSYTTAPAARDTAFTARPENRNTTAAPITTPTSVFGAMMSLRNASLTSPNVAPASVSARPIASEYDPNSAVAASTAVEIAMPLVIALVVLPTASNSVRICAPSPSVRSPDISAMPCALSDTGPKVSIATMTPTVVSSPVPANATAN